MKKLIITFLIGLFTQQITQAQGMIYLSNLGQASAGSISVGSDSWYAMLFQTGNNVGGYTLDSIQLGLANATGSPSDFMVEIYAPDPHNFTGASPGDSLGILSGSLNPATAGIYTYVPGSSLALSPGTDYFIVLTAATTIANGAYELNYASSPAYNASDHWAWGDGLGSNNGTSWHPQVFYHQFAISATPVPEPGVLNLLGLGGAALLWRRRAKTAR
jgi:hypothetical protein